MNLQSNNHNGIEVVGRHAKVDRAVIALFAERIVGVVFNGCFIRGVIYNLFIFFAFLFFFKFFPRN